MIGFGEAHPDFLPEPKERKTQQANRYCEKKRGPIFVPYLEEGADKANDQEKRRAHPTGQGQVCRAVQEFGPPPQSRNIRLEVSPSGIGVTDFIQIANAVQNICYPTEQDRDEGGNSAEDERRGRRMRHQLGKLISIRDNVHASATSVSEMGK
jgi:hypothetical protein